MKPKVHEPYDKVKDAFYQKRITYDHVGAVIGRTGTTVQLKLNGESDFYISEVHKICEKWDIPISFFSS